MRLLKVLSVFGTRPEAIKMAPVIKELARRQASVSSVVCVTGQHREMLDQALALFDIVPDHDLNVMVDDQSPSGVAASILTGLEPILMEQKPYWVLVQGDTTTVAAVAMAAYYHRAKVGHVEAGLRTGDKWRPFPEEVNRRIASVVAELHFAPTKSARQNLLNEGIPEERIIVTGNPVIDALRMVADLPYDPASGPLHDVPPKQRIILVTAHRRESFGEPLRQICAALRELALTYAGRVCIVYPVHSNPHVRETVFGMLRETPGIRLTNPLDYLAFVHLMKRSTLVLTDSGGIQEEAPGLGKPVLVLRDVTERPEAIMAGTARLVGTNSERIVHWTRRLLDDPKEYEKMANAMNPYGDGQAARRIVDTLLGPDTLR